jgi:hypothetical protein
MQFVCLFVSYMLVSNRMRGKLPSEKMENLYVTGAIMSRTVRCNIFSSTIQQMNSWLADVCVRLKVQAVN